MGELGGACNGGCKGTWLVVGLLCTAHDHPRDLRVNRLVGGKGGQRGDGSSQRLRRGTRWEGSDGTGS